ncbi:MAG: Smr/MutS family protein [Alphaproteobacteria bacterium]|nr:Smr/MutS family protein [Alphaproteobacteria bacterium]MBV8548032.1 Smr/MutS family protein [Alphaproteobacteria bacterium]
MTRHDDDEDAGDGGWRDYKKSLKPLGAVAVKRTGTAPQKPDQVTIKNRVAKDMLKPGHRAPKTRANDPPPVDGRLDLHGMTLTVAHKVLVRFIERQRAADERRVLIITGKGDGGTETLRTQVPRWLAAPQIAAQILSVKAADKRHGGLGALYVHLRKG